MEQNDNYFNALETRSINSVIDQHILLTEDDRELAYLGATLLNKALNILTLLAPADALRKAVLLQLDEKKDNYDELMEALQSFTLA